MVQSVSHCPPPIPARARRTLPLWHTLAAQDWLVLSYLVALFAVCVGGAGPRRETAIAYVAIDLAIFAVAIGLSRGGFLPKTASPLVYRLGIFAGLFGSFSHLQYILPTARVTAVDASIYALDRAVFGFEPAEVFDRFVSTATVEWFSFFYFGYFFVLAVHIFPFMFAVRNMRLLSEFSLGISAIFCIGHLLYVIVPGFGPYQYLAGTFRHELEGPLWWPLVRMATDAGEVRARTDIFPSLHTAAPVFFALFALRHRRLRPFGYTWLPMAFFASQIIVSTMFLRWHYFIDVIAGIALASTVAWVVPKIVRWEEGKRQNEEIEPVFCPLVAAKVTAAGIASESAAH